MTYVPLIVYELILPLLESCLYGIPALATELFLPPYLKLPLFFLTPLTVRSNK
jgi:hypothetical protein